MTDPAAAPATGPAGDPVAAPPEVAVAPESAAAPGSGPAGDPVALPEAAVVSDSPAAPGSGPAGDLVAGPLDVAVASDSAAAPETEPPGDIVVPDVAVVAVTYSPGEALDAFLDTLEKATTRRYEVLLADNGSTDGAPERAAARPVVRVVPTGGNLGYGRAANAGVAQTAAPLVLIANPDVVFEPDALDTLIDAADRWPRAAAFGPLIRRPDGSRYPSARALPSLGRGIGHALCGWWWPGNPWTQSYRRERAELVESPAGWLSGSCLLVRRAAFEQVRGFDPAYFMYFEDLDLCERLGRAGWQCVYVPAAVVTHEGGHATRRHRAAMVAAHHHSAYRYLSRRYAGWRFAPLRLVLRVGLAGRAALARVLPEVGRGT